MESKQIMQANWCLQSINGDTNNMIVASTCKNTETANDDDKDHYPQLWLFEQVSQQYCRVTYFRG